MSSLLTACTTRLAVEGARMPAVPRSEWTDFEPPDSGCSDEDEPLAARSSGSKLEPPSSHAAASTTATPSPVPRKRQRLALQEDLFRFDDENDEHAVRILAAGEEGAAELEDVSQADLSRASGADVQSQLDSGFFASAEELAALERGEE